MRTRPLLAATAAALVAAAAPSVATADPQPSAASSALVTTAEVVYGQGCQIWSMNDDGTGAKVVVPRVTGGPCLGGPTISRTGRYVAYTAVDWGSGGQTSLKVLDRSNGATKTLVPSGVHPLDHPDFSPTTDELVFIRRLGDMVADTTVHSVLPDGTGLRSWGIPYAMQARWSADGRSVLYSGSHEPWDCAVQPYDGGWVVTYDELKRTGGGTVWSRPSSTVISGVDGPLGLAVYWDQSGPADERGECATPNPVRTVSFAGRSYAGYAQPRQATNGDLWLLQLPDPTMGAAGRVAVIRAGTTTPVVLTGTGASAPDIGPRYVRPAVATSLSVSGPGVVRASSAGVSPVTGYTVVVSSTGGTPVGRVSWSLDGVAKGSVVLSGGKASISLPAGVAPGKHVISVSYAGGGDFAGSSATKTVYVKVPSTTKGNLSVGSWYEGATVWLTLTVRPSPDVPVTGTLTLKDGARTVWSAKVPAASAESGRVRVRMPALAPGRHKISASYGGSFTILPSKTGTATVTVY